MTTFLKKFKKPYFGGYLWSFFQNLSKNDFFWKKKLKQFLHIPIIYHHAKNQKKLMSHPLEKCRTDGRTDRQTGR